MQAGDIVTLAIEKPVAGGRMLARHDGQIVFVSGAIPGERVQSRVEQVKGDVAFAIVTAVEEPSADRRAVHEDPLCGGAVYSHIAYARQLALKGEVVADAFARLARTTLPVPVAVRPSPEQGYRMRARLHARHGRLGFFREGTHELCDLAAGGQLLPGTAAVLRSVEARLGDRAGVVREVEVSENISASERVMLVETADAARQKDLHAVLHAFDVPEVHGVMVVPPNREIEPAMRGSPFVSDTLNLTVGSLRAAVAFRRHVSAFFQGNRFLLQPLVEAVLQQVPPGDLLDLYAGAGIFGVSHAALGRGQVTAVEGDRQAAADLLHNAQPFIDRVRVEATPVEYVLRRDDAARGAGAVLVDPPRTGMSKDALGGILRTPSPRIVYVSCDVATLARDVRKMLDAGRTITHIEAFDLFPNTAHVETVVTLDRRS